MEEVKEILLQFDKIHVKTQHKTYFSDPGNSRHPFPVLNLAPAHTYTCY